MQPIYSFGAWLKQRRSALGLTQNDLAGLVGCAVVTLRKIEADERRPSAQIAARLAEHLDLSPGDQALVVRVARGERPADSLPAPGLPQPPHVPTSGHSVPAAPGGLPVPATPLIGRAAEVAAIVAELDDPAVRLVTLTGPPGIGKTRLSLAVAEVLRATYPLTWFVPLAAITSEPLARSAIAQALGVKQDAPAEALHERLRSILQARQLLVLDNFEHLLNAAPLVAELLGLSPAIKILVTSRAALRLSAEHEYPVPPLALPAPDGMAHAAPQQPAAVELFVQRARAVDRNFQLHEASLQAVAQICIRLDGLPLAIELAAARCKLFTPQALLARLDSRLTTLTGGARDLPARQQTLRAAIEWSYQLLNPPEQRLFAWLGVFASGWNLDLAAALIEADTTTTTELLATLLDQSLIRRADTPSGQPRLVLLETLREYALERLAAMGELEAAEQRRAQVLVAFAERERAQRFGAQHYTTLRNLDDEHNNLRAVLAWVLEQPPASGTALPARLTLGLRLADALVWYWVERGHLNEGQSWYERLLRYTSNAPQSAAHGQALGRYSLLTSYLGAYNTARPLAEQSLAIFQALGDQVGIARAQNMLSWVLMEQGELGRARALAEMALAGWQALGDQLQIQRSLANLGWLTQRQGEYALSHDYFSQALALYRAQGDTQHTVYLLTNLGDLAYTRGDDAAGRAYYNEGVAILRQLRNTIDTHESVHMLAWAAYRRGNYSEALALFEENIAQARSSGHVQDLAWALNHCGDALRCIGQYADAERQYYASLEYFERLGHRQGIAAVQHNLGYVALHAGDVDQAATLFNACLATFRQLGYTWSVADALAGLGAVAAARNELAEAARLLGTAEAMQKAIDASGFLLEPANRIEWNNTLAQLQAGLPPDELAHAWGCDSPVSRLPSSVPRPPSSVPVFRPRPPSSVLRPPSSVPRLPSSVFRLPSSVYPAASTTTVTSASISAWPKARATEMRWWPSRT